MKKLVSLFLLLLISKIIFGQQDPIFVPGTTKEDYLKKSKNQKTAAWVLLGTGSLSILAGSIEVNPNYGGSTNRSFLVIGGLVATGASVACFIASRRNKKRAASIAFGNQYLPQLNNRNLVVRSFHLKISL
jgi:hypothetical protein